MVRMVDVQCSQLLLPLYLQQLHFKYQSGSSWNLGGRTSVSIPKVGGDLQLSLLTLTHPEKSLVPSLDHLTTAQSEHEGLSTRNAAVKLSTVLQSASVVHMEFVSIPRLDGALFGFHPLLHSNLQLYSLIF